MQTNTQAAQGWLPIETAPKDGADVLLWLSAPWSKVEKAHWFHPWQNWQRGDDDPDSHRDEYCGIGSDIPSHWQPLPAAPAADPFAGIAADFASADMLAERDGV